MTQLSRADASCAKQDFFWNDLTDFIAASPSAPASQFAGPSRPSSTVPTRTSPLPEVFQSRPLPPLPPLRIAQNVGEHPSRSSTFDQLISAQYSLPHSEPPVSPPPPPPPQLRRFNTVEPVYVHSVLKAPSPSCSGGAWECREGEDILLEDQVERCLSRSFRSQDADNMGQCDFRIFELGKDRYNLPTRRIAIRSCENGDQCISFCEAPSVIDVLQKCLLNLNRDATRQRPCRN